MLFDGEMPSDTVAIHPIPIPPEFARGRRSRRISVGLAFDPPVRRQRREYLAGEMVFDLLRNVSVDDIRGMYERQDPDSRVPLFSDRRRMSLEPGVQAVQHSALSVRRVRHQRLDPDDGDTYYLVVTHRSAQWADEGDQKYALAVELAEEESEEIDLYVAVQQQVRLPARVRVR
jgi:hypothetical protein